MSTLTSQEKEKIALEVLSELEILLITRDDISWDIVKQTVDLIAENFGLSKCPFTGMLCTSEEAEKNWSLWVNEEEEE